MTTPLAPTETDCRKNNCCFARFIRFKLTDDLDIETPKQKAEVLEFWQGSNPVEDDSEDFYVHNLPSNVGGFCFEAEKGVVGLAILDDQTVPLGSTEDSCFYRIMTLCNFGDCCPDSQSCDCECDSSESLSESLSDSTELICVDCCSTAYPSVIDAEVVSNSDCLELGNKPALNIPFQLVYDGEWWVGETTIPMPYHGCYEICRDAQTDGFVSVKFRCVEDATQPSGYAWEIEAVWKCDGLIIDSLSTKTDAANCLTGAIAETREQVEESVSVRILNVPTGESCPQ